MKYFILITILTGLMLCTFATHAQRPYITVWKTDNPGASAANQITLPATGNYVYTWEAVSPTPAATGSGSASGTVTITFPVAGTYRLRIIPTGAFAHSLSSVIVTTDAQKLLRVEQWGDVQWSSMNAAFATCSNMTMTATDAPDLSNVTDMSSMFWGATAFNQDISSWNTGNVTNMRNMFTGAIAFNQDISTWSTGKVTNMSGMFLGADAFNQDISGWSTGKVTNMSGMFYNATSFNQNLSNWKLSLFSGGNSMFYNSGMDCNYYSQTLIGWANNALTASNVNFTNQKGMIYGPAGQAARNTLIAKGWTFNNSDTYNAGCSLPVVFGNIGAAIKNRQLTVNWQTLTEEGCAYYDIEASADGEHFTKIATVESKTVGGNSDQLIHYSFELAVPALSAIWLLPLYLLFVKRKRRLPLLLSCALATFISFTGCNKQEDINNDDHSSKAYIRIAQIDKDGAKTYSKVVKVVRE